MTMKIARPGIYRMPAAAYHADVCPAPSLSSGIVRTLLSRTPAHARQAHPRLSPCYEPVHKPAFDLGTITHAMVLNDHENFVIVDGDDWRGKRGQLRDDAWAAGRTPLLRHQYDEARERAAACHEQLAHHDAAGAFDPRLGTSELTIVWQEGDVWCRCRPDWLPRARGEGMVVYDYKTTATLATPAEWGSRTSRNIGAVTQAAWYRRGVRKHFGIRDVRFRFVPQEIERPWLLMVYEVDPEAMDEEDEKITRAVALWDKCLKTGHWPGYGPHIEPLDAGPRQEWREEMHERRRDTIETLMDAAAAAQRPLEMA